MSASRHKDIAGKTIGLAGIPLGDVVAAERPVAVSGENFICGDGEGGIVVKNTEGTKTLLNSADAIVSTLTTDSTTSTTGALKTAGGLGVAKAANIGTNLAVEGATDSTTSVTGSLKTAGGLGVAKAANIGTTLGVGTNLTVSGDTDSTSSTTGSLKTAGGLGVAKKAFVGTSVHSPSFTDATAVSGVDVTPTTAVLKAVSKNMVNAGEDTLGFYHGTTAVAQFSALGTTTGFLSATGNAVLAGSTFTGDTGSTAYTLGDVVKALKLLGFIKS